MKALWKNSPKQGSIKSAYYPEKNQQISGVVMVIDYEGRGFSYVKFDGSFVERLGRKMPYGVGTAHPAYLKVVQRLTGSFQVFCCYINEEFCRLLWNQSEKPEWVKRVRRVPTNGTKTTKEDRGQCKPSDAEEAFKAYFDKESRSG